MNPCLPAIRSSDRILRETSTPNLLDILSDGLTPTDLQSLLLEAYRRRAAKVTPAALLAQHERNRFTRPATVDPQVLLDFDRLAFAHANPPFTPIELAPVTPLGANSVVGLVDQNKAVVTSRNTEVVSDSTNVLALECAVRRRSRLRTPNRQNDLVRLCASHRLLRAQSYGDPLSLAHFRLFALCSAGRGQVSFQFELAALHEQLAAYLRLLSAAIAIGYRIAHLRVALPIFPPAARRNHCAVPSWIPSQLHFLPSKLASTLTAPTAAPITPAPVSTSSPVTNPATNIKLPTAALLRGPRVF